jgi:uncharacterized protein (DUF924 family)
MTTPEDVLAFWFPEGHDDDPASLEEQMRWWFRGGDPLDREIESEFEGILDEARRGELDGWAETSYGRLALILVLDQFARSIHRGTPEAYLFDGLAQALVIDGIKRGMHEELTCAERTFFLLPLSHSEDLALHDVALPLVAQIVEEAPPEMREIYAYGLEQARRHRETIARFGRHPHRNPILGRDMTEEEETFLETEGPVHLRPMP